MLTIAQRNDLKQTIKLTTSMQQRINMLQMSNLELNHFILNELSTNSLLEDDNIVDLAEIKAKEDEVTDDNYSSATSSDDSHYDFLSNIAAQNTLKDHLAEQINIEFSDHIEKSIALYLLDSLLGSGYLDYNRDETANFLRCSLGIIDRVLLKLQKLDPPGIFARDLKECLKIQANNINADAKLILIIDNLELLGKGEFKKLEKICNINNDQLKDLIAQLKKLNPKPGNGFLEELSTNKIPDLILTINNNSFNLELNDESIPRVRINDNSYERIKSSVRNQQDKLFLKEELSSANNLIKGIDDRSKTIVKIASYIINEQANFFTHGIMYLKPLTLSHIAKLVGFNESTVSRATANKYIATPRGVFELKYFFSSHLSNTKTQENNVSSTKVKELVRQIILSEEIKDILSDEQISQQLKKFNINIARRTVTKYREMLGIPTSSYRKRQYNIESQ